MQCLMRWWADGTELIVLHSICRSCKVVELVFELGDGKELV